MSARSQSVTSGCSERRPRATATWQAGGKDAFLCPLPVQEGGAGRRADLTRPCTPVHPGTPPRTRGRSTEPRPPPAHEGQRGGLTLAAGTEGQPRTQAMREPRPEKLPVPFLQIPILAGTVPRGPGVNAPHSSPSVLPAAWTSESPSLPASILRGTAWVREDGCAGGRGRGRGRTNSESLRGGIQGPDGRPRPLLRVRVSAGPRPRDRGPGRAGGDAGCSRLRRRAKGSRGSPARPS